MRTILAGLCSGLVLVPAAVAEPLPENPVTGKPVKPTIGYFYDTVDTTGRWRMRCFVPLKYDRWCEITGETRKPPALRRERAVSLVLASDPL